MKNKCLFTLAAIAVLSAQCVSATEITGITGSNGTYNISPERTHGSVAYRQYEKFILSNGHVANLDFQNDNTEAFINLVGQQINIDGVLNTVKGSQFHNGHAIFISPNGMVIGEHGVLNVGRLSVATPTATKYQSLLNDYNNETLYNYTNINKVSELKNDGNAPIQVEGIIFTNRGADLSGSAMSVPGKIVNGLSEQSILTSKSAADNLFSTLVNSNGLPSKTYVISNGNNLLIRSHDKSGAGVDISGYVINLDSKTNTSIINRGENGMNISGTVAGQGTVVGAFNKKGAQNITGTISGANKASISNKGTGALLLDTYSNVKGKTVHISNINGASLTANGSINGTNTVAISNEKGAMNLNKQITVTNGGTDNGTSIYNKGTKLTTGTNSTINNTGGKVVIRNDGASGLELKGAITNTGVTAINNYAGDMTVNGNIEGSGNMGIINRSTDGGLTIVEGVTVKNNAAATKIINLGSKGTTIDGTVDGKGATYVFNNNGALNVNGTVKTNGANLYVLNKKNATGMSINDGATVQAEGAKLAISNRGVASGNTGLNIGNANIKTTGANDLAINNYAGKLNTAGSITAGGNLGIINRSGGTQMDVFSTIVNSNASATTNIKQLGNGNMNVGGTMTNAGRVNVLDNTGKLNLTQNVNNSGYYYATSRQNGTGLNVGENFNATGTGTVLLKNISGADGFVYNGTIQTTGNQAAIVNKTGNMTVNGTVKATGAPAIIYNSGGGVTMNAGSTLSSNTEAKVVNTGTSAAVLNGTITAPDGTRTLYERVKE